MNKNVFLDSRNVKAEKAINQKRIGGSPEFQEISDDAPLDASPDLESDLIPFDINAGRANV